MQYLAYNASSGDALEVEAPNQEEALKNYVVSSPTDPDDRIVIYPLLSDENDNVQSWSWRAHQA